MKQLLLFTLISFILTCSIKLPAQNRIGIRAGYQSSNWFDTDGNVLGDPLQNFYIGVFKDKKLFPAFHFGAGLEYFQNGYKGTGTDDKQVLHMLSVPVYGKAILGPVFGLAGIGVNLKVSEKIFFNDAVLSPQDEQKSKAMDFPLFIGAGFKLLMFSIEARYHWGLVGINHGLHNRYLQLGAGVSF
jgi:hypothetical protein